MPESANGGRNSIARRGGWSRSRSSNRAALGVRLAICLAFRLEHAAAAFEFPYNLVSADGLSVRTIGRDHDGVAETVRIVAFTTNPDELEPLLLRHGEPLQAPIAAPARSPPQLELDWIDDEPT